VISVGVKGLGGPEIYEFARRRGQARFERELGRLVKPSDGDETLVSRNML
jgi:hypothetical protein